MMYWYGSGMSGWGYALMTVSMVLFWGAVIFGMGRGAPGQFGRVLDGG